jgi:exonuclease VII small subunit
VARLKRSSTILETARQRLSGLKSITPKPDFGPALDIDEYEQDINNFSASLDKYNQTVSLLDQMQNSLEADEANLNDKSKRMLAATGAQYGPNSNEYEGVGGTRLSEHKRPSKKKKPGDS